MERNVSKAAVLLSAAALSGAFSLAAFAEPVSIPQSTEPQGTIFTEGQNQEPSFKRGGKRFGGGRGKRFGGAHNQNRMGWHQLQMLPSLTPSQRQEIRGIFKQAKADIQPDVEELKALKQQREKGGQLSPDAQAKFQTIKTRLKARREEIMTKVKAKLTPAQIDELQQMHKGELKPPPLKDG